MKKELWTIFDCQFGSTGKGLLAGYLAKTRQPDTVVTAWGPNAGHTFIDSSGRKFVHTMLANGVVSPNLRQILIGPGSVINEKALLEELDSCKDLVDINQVYIHENAAIVLEQHALDEEYTMTKIASTKKGTGAAVIQRIQRQPDSMNIARVALKSTLRERVVSSRDWLRLFDDAQRIQVEGAQGFSLSMYHGFYPYTTSRDVSVAQTLADCGVPYGISNEVIGTCRTYPIRVANRFGVSGVQTGFSGPHYDDQEETSFESLGQPTELTTVTKLPRRIFTYSKKQMEQAISQNGVSSLFLNFANYSSHSDLADIMSHLNGLARVQFIGWGPNELDVQHV